MSITAKMMLFLLPFIFYGGSATGCTIFYVGNDSAVIAGNNEDWKDPLTFFWIIPPENGHYGWIKFGFQSGFPQGGMNEHGLFWDATSGPYLAMPVSEATKEKYNGALMQKVMEECSSTSEAKQVFAGFYCADQYRAQYLLGDTSNHSMIVEGDGIIEGSGKYQVLTNFYQSHPDLGGYPCWRYEEACQVLDTCTAVTTGLIGYILAATHQEGKFPTQYSIIYDLLHKSIVLFHDHNYDEYLFLELEKELTEGERSYNIPSIFSGVELLAPANDEVIRGNTITISWAGKEGSEYEVIYSTDRDFEDFNTVYPGQKQPVSTGSESSFGVYLSCLVGLLLLLKKRMVMLISWILIISMNFHCKKDENPGKGADKKEFCIVIGNLDAGQRYYWKIASRTECQSDFQTHSVTRQFTVENKIE